MKRIIAHAAARHTPREAALRLAAALALLAAQPAALNAAVVAYDGFESYAPGAPLAGQGAANQGFTNAWAQSAAGSGFTVAAARLAYTNGPVKIDGGGRALKVTEPNKRKLVRGFPSRSDGALYTGFLFHSPSAGAADAADADWFLLALAELPENKYDHGALHAQNWYKSGYAFATRAGKGREAAMRTSETPGGTHFIVFKFFKSTPVAANFNTMHLFVDPGTAYEPEPTYAYTLTDSGDPASLAWLTVQQQSLEAGDEYFIDEVRVTEDWLDAVCYGAAEEALPPVITPRGAQFGHGGGMVALEPSTPGAQIIYTLDGTEPSPQNGAVYTAPFMLTASAQVRAAAFAPGLAPSVEASADFYVPWLWQGGDPATAEWHAPGNWLAAAAADSPEGKDLLFGYAGQFWQYNNNWTDYSYGPSNVVAHNLTAASLMITNNSVEMPKPVPNDPNRYSWRGHRIFIPEGAALTVTGSIGRAEAFYAGLDPAHALTGKPGSRTEWWGGGALAIDAPDKDVILRSHRDGTTTFDASRLGAFTANAREIVFARGAYNGVVADLPRAGAGLSVFNAQDFIVAESAAEDGNGGIATRLWLGVTNEINAARIFVGAPHDAMQNNSLGGTVAFAAALSGSAALPAVRIRGAGGGDARADLWLASHGTNGTASGRSVYAQMDFRGGVVDARFGAMRLAVNCGMRPGGAQYATAGSTQGIFHMDAGVADAEHVALGQTWKGGISVNANDAAYFPLAELNVSGGVFRAGSVVMAESLAGAPQRMTARINAHGTGAVLVAGDVVMGRRFGAAPALTSRLDVAESARMEILGDVYAQPQTETGLAAVRQEVFLRGGILAVTNAAGSASLSISNGVLRISGGAAKVDALDISAPLAELELDLSAPGAYGAPAMIEVNGAAEIGGALTVCFAEGFTPKGGDSWTVINADAVNGEFAQAQMPDSLRMRRSPGVLQIICPNAATTLFIR